MRDDRAMHALLRLELKRALPHVLHTLGLAVLATLVLVAFRAATPQRLAFIMTFVAISAIGAVFQNLIRDKLDGGMEFLVFLPVDRGVLARARLAPCVAAALPAGACLGIGAALALRAALPATSVVTVGVGCAALAAVGVAVTTSLGVGIALRIKAKQFANLMFAGFLAAVGLVWLLRRVPHPSREAVLAAAASQWFPAALIGTLTVVTVGAGWVAYHLARTGLERFRPERDKLT